MDEVPRLSDRARRALPLIAAALAAIVVAGLLYLNANVQTPLAPTAKTVNVHNRLDQPYPRTTTLLGSGLALTSDGGAHWTHANVPKPD